VNCVREDKNDNLWISTNNGLSKFNPAKNTFTNYYTADGLPGPDLTGWGACFQSSTGEMFFGGFSGGVAFHPENVVDTPYLPPVMFTGLRLFGIPVTIGGGSPLAQSIGYTQSLSLSHDNANFSLEFAALSYFNSAANRYRYRLEGLDSQWHEVDSNQRLATYTTLPAGSYTFRVQGATTRSDWKEPGLAMRITIRPAWWNTWWFRMMYIAIILFSVWGAYRYRLHRLAEQYTVRMEERVNERTRIARELHDTLLQGLQALIFRFQVATEQIPESIAARGYLEDALERSEQVMAEGRDRVRDLRMTPVESDDLAHAFAAVGNDLKQSYPANFSVAITGDCRELQPIVRDEFYRIGREALSNAFRHAGAGKIEAEIVYELSELCIQFRDDGCGIEPGIVASGCRSGHWGLTGMRERAQQIGAKMEIWSRPGGGTKIELKIPAAIAYQSGLRGLRWRWLLRLAGGGSR
jgi:signal transduction histidine kinase